MSTNKPLAEGAEIAELTAWLAQQANALFGARPQGEASAAAPLAALHPQSAIPQSLQQTPQQPSHDQHPLQHNSPPLGNAHAVNPADFGLPNEDELRALLAPKTGFSSQIPASASGIRPVQYAVPSGFADPLQARPDATAAPALDVHLIRQDFPILRERIQGKPLIWLDNAATTQKPQAVIDRISHFYAHENSNIHRAAHELAARATDAYEGAREIVRGFLNARSVNEIIFVRGTTEGINLIAKSWGEAHIGKGDEIIVSHLEHHANIVPWQQLAAKTGAVLRVIPVDDDGQVLLEEYAKLLNSRTRLVSFTQVSNALGTVTPAKKIIEMAHSAGAKVLLDGAQSVSHMRSDVAALNCDWFVFSGHKVFGPTGIGVVYGKEEILNDTPPWQGGGNMIKDVTFEHTQYHAAPTRFEAGTGNIADAVGLGAALQYVSNIGIDRIAAYEHQLLIYATRLLKGIPGLRLIGTAQDKASVLSFVLEGFETAEVGALLNKEGIAVRSGHHCAQPVLRRFGLEATVRPSLAFYNHCGDIDTLVATLVKIQSGRSRL
ncbi:cysteine desulfurase [Iodobacter sp. HSC-16F04]|uniref:cysteine desulfurase n=1 Tax=Iodobacter violaceini TaxID=3044271 RepID=A0ABX0KPS8_9NEIS|nr:family 2A encapsulin nanocompartment cargo protein cysteine desulfurase [Iodobacter violacea]NHQ86440.1 cysteine desulfurase [Iodobacter violacea]